MIVSTDWLAEYVPLTMPRDELEYRLMMSGLNHEGTEQVGDDFAIDLEVTSNRPDCLGHIGVAREISVLYQSPLKIPDPQPRAAGGPIDALTQVTIECGELCPRYTARVIRGVKVGPSPDWLARRLTTLGVAVINNIVDITNYVMLECGQPLHAFDFARLNGQRIVVRAAQQGEKFTAIDHREYELDPSMCVIADAKRAVALGGVMGGADTEVMTNTTDVLIEAADFAPLTIRTTARKLNLHSDSSYRFERTVDPEGIDWASRRCCELILDLAGGELADGVAAAGTLSSQPEMIKLRFAQVKRVVGIDVSTAESRRILNQLGCQEVAATNDHGELSPPSWRRDLRREIDLIEEIARIHGYDNIPEDVGVAMVASTQPPKDRAIARLQTALLAAGFDEAKTISAVELETLRTLRPWTTADPLRASTPVLRRADCLRQSLLPSLLEARRTNEKLSNSLIELFEISHIYLPRPQALPDERLVLAITSGSDFLSVKGVVELLLTTLGISQPLGVAVANLDLLHPTRSCRLTLDQADLGVLGELGSNGLAAFDLRSPAAVAELDLHVLIQAANLIPQAAVLSSYPSVERDLNVVFDESVRWDAVSQIAASVGGRTVEELTFQEEYRDRKQLGKGKKSLLFRLRLRSSEGTLTSEEADAIRDSIVEALGGELGGTLRA